jgi:hypothetical protein
MVQVLNWIITLAIAAGTHGNGTSIKPLSGYVPVLPQPSPSMVNGGQAPIIVEFQLRYSDSADDCDLYLEAWGNYDCTQAPDGIAAGYEKIALKKDGNLQRIEVLTVRPRFNSQVYFRIAAYKNNQLIDWVRNGLAVSVRDPWAIGVEATTAAASGGTTSRRGPSGQFGRTENGSVPDSVPRSGYVPVLPSVQPLLVYPQDPQNNRINVTVQWNTDPARFQDYELQFSNSPTFGNVGNYAAQGITEGGSTGILNGRKSISVPDDPSKPDIYSILTDPLAPGGTLIYIRVRYVDKAGAQHFDTYARYVRTVDGVKASWSD